MSNNEILTSLKNAVERGESLQSAMQVMINSGYNPQEVQEASKFVSGASIPMQAKPDEQLTMPEKKGFFSRFKKQKITQPIQQPKPPSIPLKNQTPKINQQTTPQTLQQNPLIQQQSRVQQPKQIIAKAPLTPQQAKDSEPITKQLTKIGSKKPNYFKEIMLLVILLILVGVLILTIVFKDEIIGLFS